MIPLVFGMFGANWLVELLKKRDSFWEMENSYTDRNVSDWVINHIINSEGYREKAYYATLKELKARQFTIGCGTSYLFSENGSPFITNHPFVGGNGVRSTDTLTGLKKSMGYSHLSSKDFAVQLVRNYLLGNGVSSFIFLTHIQRNNAPYYSSVKDAVLEFSYGSGSVHKAIRGDYKSKSAVLNRVDEFNSFINSLRTNNLHTIAVNYAYLRYRYYSINARKQWLEARWSWMSRVYACAMHIKGVRDSVPCEAISKKKDFFFLKFKC